MVGRLGALELSVVILGNSVFNITGYSIMIGLASGMETLCGQAFGAGQLETLDLILHRAILILLAACLPVYVGFWFLGAGLRAAGQDEDISALAGQYIWTLWPSLPAYGVTECVKRYLQAMNIVQPGMYISMASLVATPLIMYLFVFYLGYGVMGAAYGMNACTVLQAVLFGVYAH
eukprot:CAMPEP_0182893678 /NCGR_PEP_ID=MMETSP0034_2-20130328/24623_1 /TAXON_ID=156128 /ORGANISM="Nephroselmis pyriformis, Strain CCMP717" /LENGTH=175 /DNA_ID=CAMNT_0025027435 /DNA_START=44 /DNA_END=568 /DNA_ORIENTATION=+